MNLGPRLALAAAALMCTAAIAKAEDVSVKIGVLTDMSSLYSDIGGPGSVAAAKLAVEDFNPAAHGMKVEVVAADHQNKPDVGAGIARQWYDVDHVDVIVDVPTSSVALAISEVTREKKQSVPRFGTGKFRSDRTEMFAKHHPVDLRHLDAGKRHRQGVGQDWRRYLVLFDLRLRFRPCARTRHRGGSREERR